jgi:hypothetical protein
MSIGFALLAVVVAGLIAWRGIALYRYTFHKKNL